MNGEREAGREAYNKRNSSSVEIAKVLWKKWLLYLDQKKNTKQKTCLKEKANILELEDKSN